MQPRGLQAVLLLVCSLSALAVCRACSPLPGWRPKTLAQLVPDTPVVLVVNLTRVDGDINIQEAVATVHCVLKHANLTGTPSQLLGKPIRITRYGTSAMCRSEAVQGAAQLVMLQQLPVTTPPTTLGGLGSSSSSSSSSSNSNSIAGLKLPTYSLVYADISSGARPATQANIDAARAALTPQQRAAAVCRSSNTAPLVLPGQPAKPVAAKAAPSPLPAKASSPSPKV
jgi:hypothetical protein